MNEAVRFDGFDWDAHNETKIVTKHGIHRETVETAMRGSFKLRNDPHHSKTETRFIALAQDASGRDLYISFTLREQLGKVLVRPISARYMHPREVKRHDD